MTADRSIAVDADIIKGTGDGLAEIGKIFRTGAALQGHYVDPVGAVLLQDMGDLIGNAVVIDTDRGEGDDVQIEKTAVRRGYIF